MTGPIDLLSPQEPINIGLDLERLGGVREISYPTVWWQNAVAGVVLPEELFTKAIGQILTDNPKYDQSVGNFHRQVGFHDLLADSGMGAGLAVGLGLAIAIANPLDPVNKFALPGRLTKSAHLLANLRKAAAVNEALVKTVTVGGKAIKQFDTVAFKKGTTELEERIAFLEKNVPAERLAKVAHADELRSSKSQLLDRKANLPLLEEKNALLRRLQVDEGVDFEREIASAPSFVEQVRSGERSLFGFTSPLRMNHIPFLPGQKATRELNNAVAFSVPGIGHGRLAAAAAGLGQGILKGAKEGASAIINRTLLATRIADRNVIQTAVQKSLFNELRAFMQAGGAAKTEEFLTSAMRLFNKHPNLTSVERRQIIEAVEQSGIVEVGIARALKDLVSDTPVDELNRKIVSSVRAIPEEAVPIGVLTKGQQTLMTPSRIGAGDVRSALDEWDARQLEATRLQGGHQVVTTRRYVVQKLSGDFGAMSGRELRGIFSGKGVNSIAGLPRWRVAARGNERFLIARKIPSGSRPTRVGLQMAHLDNLGNTAAQLSGRAAALTSLDADNVLVAPFGGIQLLDPELFLKNTQKGARKGALFVSEGVVRKFAGEQSLIDPITMNLPMLRNPAAAKVVGSGARHYTFVQSHVDEALGISGSEVGHIDTGFFLGAENASGIRQLLRGGDLADAQGVLDVNKVGQAVDDIRRQALAGVQPTMRPISYMVDPTGRKFTIVEGLDRLAAAAIEDFPTVPVFRRPFLGEIVDETGAFYSPSGLRLADVLDNLPDSLPSGASRIVSEGPSLKGILDDQYRVLDPSGKATGPSRVDVMGNRAVRTAVERFIRETSRFSTYRSGTSKRTAMAQLFTFQKGLEDLYGGRMAASLRLADIVNQSSDYQDFAGRLMRELEFKGSKMKLGFNPQVRTPTKIREFDAVRQLSEELLDASAEVGLFTPSSLTSRRALLAATALDRTIIGFDAAGRLRFTSSSKDLGELRKTAEDFISKVSDPDNIHFGDELALQSSRNETILPVSDLVTVPKRRIDESVMRPIKLLMTDEAKASLREQKIFYMPAGSIKKAAELVEVTNNVMNNTGMVWFKTKSGDMFMRIDETHTGESVANLVNAVFGEAAGAVSIQEWGFALKGKVVLSNPLGGAIRELTPTALKPLENRLREAAQQFLNMGIRESTLFDVVVPFRDELWKKMYGAQRKRQTLDFVSSKEFKLKVPTEERGLGVDLIINLPQGAVRVRRHKLNKAQEEIRSWMEANLDEAVRLEAASGLPSNVLSNYFPRVMPLETKQALNDAFEAMAKKFPRVSTLLGQNNHFGKRNFTDLTTTEINDLHEAGFKMSDLISEASVEEAKRLKELSSMLPGGLEFFYSDPIMATVMRQLSAFKATSEIGVINHLSSLENSGVLFNGKVADLTRVQRRGQSIDKATVAVERVETEIAELEAQMARVADDPRAAKDVQEMQIEIDKAIARRDKEYKKINDLTAKGFVGDTNGKLVVGQLRAADIDRVWVRGTTVNRLLDNGLIADADVLSHPGQDMALVRFSDSFKSVAEKEGVDILLMTPETEEVVMRLFNITNNTRGQGNQLLRLFDQVQGIWKQWTLFPIPAFHIRNSFSDLFLMKLADMDDFRDFEAAATHIRMLQKYKSGALEFDETYSIFESNRLVSETGESRSMLDLWNDFIGQGGTQGTFVYNDFNRYARRTGPLNKFHRMLEKQGAVAGSNITLESVAIDNPLIRGGRNIQSGREAWFRFSGFINGWRKTGDPVEAMHRVKAALYDYRDLTAFERNVVRRFIPFYSWSRFNIPRMFQTLALKPVDHARIQASFRNLQYEATGGPIDEKDLPEHLSAAMVISKNKDGSYVVKSLEGLLPVYDLAPLMKLPISQFIKNQVTPFLKMPIEMASGRSLFTGQDLERFPGEPSRSGTLASLSATRAPTTQGELGFINMIWNDKTVSDLFRFGKQATQVIDALANWPNIRGEVDVTAFAFATEMTVGRVLLIDPQQMAFWAQRNDAHVLRTMETVARQAKARGNMPAYNAIVNNLNYLRLLKPPSDR